jgi:phosphoribosylformylglycinamidine cyclo-ligase
LSATCIGVVEGPLVTGESTREGDVVIGLESTGLHSNGYSLARKVLLPEGGGERKLLKEMLEPTAIYSPAALEIVEHANVHGLAHVTGGAFSKLARILPKGCGVVLDGMPKPAALFERIAEEGKVPVREMYRTFNMGIGFCVVCPESETEKVLRISQKHGFSAQEIGLVEGKPGVRLAQGGKTIELT